MKRPSYRLLGAGAIVRRARLYRLGSLEPGTAAPARLGSAWCLLVRRGGGDWLRGRSGVRRDRRPGRCHQEGGQARRLVQGKSGLRLLAATAAAGRGIAARWILALFLGTGRILPGDRLVAWRIGLERIGARQILP